jgi:predicted cytidylate kinase
MTSARSIVFNGDLGSGKSTVSKLLSQRLGIRRISIGEIYRQMAHERGLTALQLNRHAELDDKIDFLVDQLQNDIAASGEHVIVDSRLAWFFFRDAFKVHLVTDANVAASRVLQRPHSEVERYTSVAQARERLASRSESERVRFIQRYGADKTRLRNYDLVCDSTRATPEEIVDTVIRVLESAPSPPALFIDPRRIAPAALGSGPVRLGYDRPRFYAIGGQQSIDEATAANRLLIAAELAEEATDAFALRRVE